MSAFDNMIPFNSVVSLNFFACSTQSLPVILSPINNIKSGFDTLTIFFISSIRLTLLCSLPAVSTRTTSRSFASAYLTASNGLYYYNFTTPNITGVYAAIANCSNPTAYSSATFHVVEHRGISPEEIWTYANRNLTDYNQSFIVDNFNTLWEYFNCTNATIQSQGVCDYLIKTYTYTEEIHTWIDDMKDQTDKIPGLRTVVNSIDNSLVQNNISSTWRFLIIVLVVSLLGFGIVIIIYLLARKTIFKREEIEEELPEENEEEIESYYV